MLIRRLIRLSTFFYFIVSSFCFAQQSAVYLSDVQDYQKALVLFSNQQYYAAQTLFSAAETATNDMAIRSDCSYYIANCAVRLNQNNADKLIIDFVENYPMSTKRNRAFLDVADYYFEQGKYAYARKWYEKTNINTVSRHHRDQFYFNFGYSLYATKNEKKASEYLKKVVNSKIYGTQAQYYLGYMAYEGDDYDTANAYFEQVSDNEKYKSKLSYYQADLNFKLGKFNEAIALAKPQLPKSKTSEASELSKIIGESYFNLQKYTEAIPFLKNYKGKKGKWNHNDYYQLGYAYYKQNDFVAAVSEFNKIIDGDNAVAQNAYYHLGESYINLNKKQEALNAFRNASEMDFDLKIQKDAWLNYAKLSYDIGNPYQSVPQVLSNFLKNYPNSDQKEDVEILLIDSYITSKNYKEALELLKGKRGLGNKTAYQKVAFYRGLELYNENKHSDALGLFEKAINENQDPIIAARATFWKAETAYNLVNYTDAIRGFKECDAIAAFKNTPERKRLNYNLAYTYFKLKDYTNAILYFEKFLQTKPVDAMRKNDAYLRMADGYFVSQNYEKAIDAYQKAIEINEIETDYATFQKAMSQGYAGKITEKIKELNAFIQNYPKSALRDDAMYALANTYVNAGETDSAMQMYNQFNSEYQQSEFASKVLLRQGLVYYNTNDNERALVKLKTVAKQFPNSAEANQAIATARRIYIDLGRVEAYATWVKSLEYYEITNSELDNTTYLAAEKPYLDNDTDRAIDQFNIYLKQFPSGTHALKSHFYLAQLYHKGQSLDEAKPHYKYVVEASKNEFSEQALIKLSEIYLSQSIWNDAIPILKRVEMEADYPQNIIYAKSNLMNAYFQIKDDKLANDYANKVLQHANLDAKIKSDAQIILARIAIKTGDFAVAKTAYAILEKSAIGELAAEALYYGGYFQNKDANFEASNTKIKELIKNYGGYKYYSAKGLVLMAKNYDALRDAFQATYILESVITNFSEFEDVIQEATTELNKIKAKEAKTNSSIEIDDN